MESSQEGTGFFNRTKIIDVYPAQDALANILAETSCNGGGPYNVLIDLARLQAPFPLAAVGLVGDDAAGKLYPPRLRSAPYRHSTTTHLQGSANLLRAT